MSLVILYAATLIFFLALDVVGISQIIRPVFERHVSALLTVPFRIGPAVAFYAVYIAGVLYFVSVPALAADAPVKALMDGALIGLMCFGTYEFTNRATLKHWSWEQVVIDSLWGGFLTGVSAWVGVAITRMVT